MTRLAYTHLTSYHPEWQDCCSFPEHCEKGSVPLPENNGWWAVFERRDWYVKATGEIITIWGISL